MKTTINNFTRLLFLFSIPLFLIFQSCEKEIPEPQEEEEELTSLELDCSDAVNDGESITLANRNMGIDYIINCVYQADGDLIIEEGVTIQFGTDAGIKVRESGSIQVLGTAENQVLFTGEDKLPGAWRGIFIDCNDPKNKIEHSTIEYAGGEAFNSNGDQGAVIVWSDTYLDLNNTTITNSKTYGINAVYGGSELLIENNTITECESPMILAGEYPTTITGGNYTGNTLDAIIVEVDQITGAHNWKNLEVPYHLPAGLQVIPGGLFTVMPGVVMKFGQDSRLFINEGASGEKPSIVAVGTPEEPIVFTSIDNTLAAWQGIYFDSPSTLNEIGFANIENASNSNQDGAIETWYGTVLNVHDVVFRNIQGCAIYQYISGSGDDTLTTSNLSFENVTNAEVCQN